MLTIDILNSPLQELFEIDCRIFTTHLSHPYNHIHHLPCSFALSIKSIDYINVKRNHTDFGRQPGLIKNQF